MIQKAELLFGTKLQVFLCPAPMELCVLRPVYDVIFRTLRVLGRLMLKLSVSVPQGELPYTSQR